ncbi:uncharacterized G-patch domain protein DDB_G0278987-like [Macadamia integrifolia]|uniref:uncharacterized G-patch domain protein DDB_G0278987-like n=1 Tax=Macadamia integrifolia TaxID=60698 RepID=UPI001C4EDC46|nr:uncharacterized G-patch domain protein DDB_G0278987-like [Macadamia integrifolia]
MDELHGSLSAFEMHIARPKAIDKTAAFKVQKKKQIKPKSEEVDIDTDTNTDTESDDGETNFVRKLKRGNGKYKGVGHFATKCSHERKDTNDESKKFKKKNTFFKKGRSKSKELNSKHHSSTSDDSFEDESEDETADEALFMALSEITEKSNGYPTTCSETDDNDEEAEVYLKEELNAALDELETERISNKKTMKKLKKAEQKILELKVQLEESNKVSDDLEAQLSLKYVDCCKLEAEVVMLSEKLKKYSTQSSTDPQTSKLDEILSC